MNLYFELLQEPIFTMGYVNQYYNNIESARSAIIRIPGMDNYRKFIKESKKEGD